MRRLRRDLDVFELSRLVPATGVVVVWTVLMFNSGGYRPGTWLPAGLVLVGLLGVAIVGGARLLPSVAAARNALLVLAAFTAWCFLSLLWSDAPGTGWEAANLLLSALAGAWTLALAPWRTNTALVLMLAFAVAVAAACLAGLLSALEASDLTSRFVDFRFAPPLDYPNTTAAFGFMAALPALLLAARPDVSIPAKAAAQALATFLCAYALLPQSRGSILGGIAAVVVLALAVPYRWRLALHALLLAVGVVVAALGDALSAILLATGIGAVGGLALAVAEARIQLDAGGQRTARLAGVAAAALAALAIVGVGVAKSSGISDTLGDQWRSLSHPGVKYAGTRANAAAGRLRSVDPLERYDYWSVSLDGSRPTRWAGWERGASSTATPASVVTPSPLATRTTWS